jgi:hypothetical protein
MVDMEKTKRCKRSNMKLEAAGRSWNQMEAAGSWKQLQGVRKQSPTQRIEGKKV